MNKKILGMALAIGLMIPMTLSARAFDFNIGATAQFQKDVNSVDFDSSDFIDINNYSFGAETRLNFLLFEVADTALLGTVEHIGSSRGSGVSFQNNLAAGIYKDILNNSLRIGLLAGPEFEMMINDTGVYNADGSSFNFVDIFMKSNFTYKAHADILIGTGLTLSASYTLPTSFNLDQGNYINLMPVYSDWENGRIGISLLLL
ncbi:MAG: hypothetical protein JJE21_05825 [Spirochaetaceae bacterium]|nr:hypothetical protein [Spirochaetaceae bacterium]